MPQAPRTSPFTKRNVGCSEEFSAGFAKSMVVAPDEAPTGIMARGHYEAVSKFVDDDNHEHLKFEWSFDISKDWK